MHITPQRRKAARALWEAGGRIEDAARALRLRPATLRLWLADGDFRRLVAEAAREPFLQATSAVLRWAPAAVARLIEDLRGESAADARQAAREILRLATESHQALARDGPPGGPAAEGLAPEDPLARRVAALTDDEVGRIFAILDGERSASKDG
jgi:hypothetical protein